MSRTGGMGVTSAGKAAWTKRFMLNLFNVLQLLDQSGFDFRSRPTTHSLCGVQSHSKRAQRAWDKVQVRGNLARAQWRMNAEGLSQLPRADGSLAEEPTDNLGPALGQGLLHA